MAGVEDLAMMIQRINFFIVSMMPKLLEFVDTFTDEGADEEMVIFCQDLVSMDLRSSVNMIYKEYGYIPAARHS